ncbi:DNA mismatch repair protein Msh6-like isoform X1 [Mizuhopecten yessoensis]|uniref:DNA mismatch repair protein Msh6-like isoform X1 n=1 Tax=Mizuhopecten yessoensis TaxID=6573 RepID=UPI000B459D63|nr:DNA mismatch repair protein Msh6-like isoform X1 [Mizuhopecten yessoensis]
MGPKQTPAKKSNTLFSYFNKSPVVKQSSTPKTDDKDILSPKRSPNQKSSSPGSATPTSKQTGFAVGDLTWTKLEGYPWWPSMVCTHPTDNIHFKGGKNPQVHVQFFDDPVSRAWIKAKNVHHYKGSNDKEYQMGGQFFSHNPKVKQGTCEADKAIKLSLEERLKLVVELQPSDEEEEEESMDLDPDIFDDEMDEETDNSKENVSTTEDKEKKKKPSKSPRKTPKKDSNKRRSTRTPKPKRRRIIENHDSEEESGDEFKLKVDSDEPSSNSSSEDEDSSGVDEDDVSDIETGSEPESPIKAPQKRKRPPPKSTNKTVAKQSDSPDTTTPSLNSFSSGSKPTSSFTPTVGDKTKSRLATFTAADSPSTSKASSSEQEDNFPHLKLDFLQPHKIKDAKMRNRTDPEYDPKTLYVPDSFKKTTTPGMRQWWELKAKYFDTILFFKMGKFYELFHMDAVAGVNELGIIFMKGEQAHSGFPEIAYNRYAETLIQKGYKVVRIEQTETPDMMSERLKTSSKQPTKFDKVVRREVCRVTSKGTQTFSFMDGDCSGAQNSFLLAIAEKEENTEGCSTYGVCFVDTSIGKFFLGQFSDDRHCSRLRTLIAHYTPIQVLFEKNKMTAKTQLVLRNNLTSVSKEGLASGSEFWDSSKTLKRLAEEDYFKDNDEFVWPATIKKMISETDALGLTAADEYSLAVRALGAVTWYLQYSLLDQELLSMNNFEEYCPLDDIEVTECKKETFAGRQHMVLDGVTLANLDITENSANGTLEGTLLEQLDHCNTPFGRRLFRQWLCAPLCNPVSINDRLDAVEDLIGCPDLVATTTEILKKLPDLERSLNRIHSLGSASKSKNHPDSRAIIYDEAKYSKKKIEDFLLTIDGFRAMSKVAKKFQGHVKDFKSKLLTKTMTIQNEEESDGHFPDLHDDIEFFEHSFDHNKAKKDGVIVPNKGVDVDYDGASADIQATERSLNLYLDRQRTRLGCKAMTFWGTGKNRYQMEVPESALKRVPDDYELFSSKKGWKRYRTSEIDEYLSELADAEERKDAALKDTMRRIFHSFDERYKTWEVALQCISVLDVLMSLSSYSRCGDGVMCRPEVVSPADDTEPFLEIRDGRHPCIAKTFSGGDFIPNDTLIGVGDENSMETDEQENANSKIILVTGPNMGGKSTLMRQVGLITVIAQMGCYVPAEKCRMTPVDRVFTRLGASDRIMAGESTFFVELSETSAILQHATQHSLVLMDELGRGTATYDGTAIACSVVEELSRRVCCRTLFSTHYHSLVEEFSHDPNIRLGHMACMVENEDETDPTQETITFLYKLSHGACPKSYGFNAAKLANIPAEIIRVAVKKSREFEESTAKLRLVRALHKDCSVDKLSNLQQQIRDA